MAATALVPMVSVQKVLVRRGRRAWVRDAAGMPSACPWPAPQSVAPATEAAGVPGTARWVVKVPRTVRCGPLIFRPQSSDERAKLQGLVAARAGADRRDRRPDHVFQRLDVGLGVAGQVSELAGLRDVLPPAVQVLIDRGGVV